MAGVTGPSRPSALATGVLSKLPCSTCLGWARIAAAAVVRRGRWEQSGRRAQASGPAQARSTRKRAHHTSVAEAQASWRFCRPRGRSSMRPLHSASSSPTGQARCRPRCGARCSATSLVACRLLLLLPLSPPASQWQTMSSYSPRPRCTFPSHNIIAAFSAVCLNASLRFLLFSSSRAPQPVGSSQVLDIPSSACRPLRRRVAHQVWEHAALTGQNQLTLLAQLRLSDSGREQIALILTTCC